MALFPQCELCNSFPRLCNNQEGKLTQLYIINEIFMGSLLYTIAAIFAIGWLIGFFVFDAGGIIHVLLVIALMTVLLQVENARRAP
jgi:hypothetical protein